MIIGGVAVDVCGHEYPSEAWRPSLYALSLDSFFALFDGSVSRPDEISPTGDADVFLDFIMHTLGFACIPSGSFRQATS